MTPFCSMAKRHVHRSPLQPAVGGGDQFESVHLFRTSEQVEDQCFFHREAWADVRPVVASRLGNVDDRISGFLRMPYPPQPLKRRSLGRAEPRRATLDLAMMRAARRSFKTRRVSPRLVQLRDFLRFGVGAVPAPRTWATQCILGENSVWSAQQQS